MRNLLQSILTVLKTLVLRLEQEAEKIGTEIWHIVQEVFKAEEQQIMAQFYVLLKAEAINLQNAKPGMPAKDFERELKSTALNVLAGMGAQLAYTAIITVVGTVLHDLAVKDEGGNAGIVTTG